MNILELIKEKERLAFSQNLNITRPLLKGDRLFKDIKTEFLEAEYMRLTDRIQLPTAAMVHAFDTEAAIGTRPTAEKVTIDKLLIKEKINQSERTQLLLKNGVTENNLVKYIYNDMGRLAESVKTRTEVAKMEVLATGKMTIKENNLDLVIDYGIPAENKVTKAWTAVDYDILGDIETMMATAKAMGQAPNRIMTSSKIVGVMKKNSTIQKAINGVYMTGVLISTSSLNALLMDLFGLTLEVADEMYAYVNAAGVRVSKRYFDANKFVIYTASVDGSIGTGLWGVTPEEAEYGQYTQKSANQFITLSMWATPDPVAVWTKASGVFIPVLPNNFGLFILTISDIV